MSIFIKNEFLYLCIIILSLNSFQNKTIFIPFKQYPIFPPSTYDKTKFLEENISPKFVSNLSLGTPEYTVPCIFNIYDAYSYIKPNEEYKDISMNDIDNNKIYDPYKSLTYKNISLMDDTYTVFNRYKLIKERIRLFNDINFVNYEEIDDFMIYIRDDKKNVFSYLDISNNKNYYIINQLKEKKIIDNNILSVKYINNYDGYYIIGNYPHIFDKEKYLKEKLILFNLEISSGKNFDILINKIYISWNELIDGKNHINREKKINFVNGISFNINLNLIIASEEYMNSVKEIFFNEYINKKICDYNIIPMSGRTYMVYSCFKNEDFKLTKFPSLKFIFYGNNYVFELNYEDLFLEKNNIYYFLVSCDYHINENWKLGKPFLKKYQFVFDGSKKLAGFYDKNKTISNIKNLESENNNKSNINIIIFFIVLNIVLIPLIFLIAKRRYMKRKINANEMNDLLVNNKKENENDSINIEIGLIK